MNIISLEPLQLRRQKFRKFKGLDGAAMSHRTGFQRGSFDAKFEASDSASGTRTSTQSGDTWSLSDPRAHVPSL